MKKRNYHSLAILATVLFFVCRVPAQAQDSTAELLMDLKYYAANAQPPYLYVYTKTKLEKKKFQAVPGIPVAVYLDSNETGSLLGKIVTDANGEGRVFIDASHKEAWDASDAHNFLGFAEAKKPYSEATAELKIAKARLVLDTLREDTIRYVTVKVEEWRDKEWVPVKDVELKAAIKRLGGDLNVGDDATYTTDSLGMVQAEFKRDLLPGDTAGYLTLVAKVEDNETYGNLVAEKKVKWGKPFIYHSTFNKASLYGTRTHAPGWLVLLASMIIFIVWGTLIYLIFQVFRIRKLGRQAA